MAVGDLGTILALFFIFFSKIVLVAVQDDASKYGTEAFPALKRLGAKEPIVLEHRSSYSLAGYAGQNLPSWVNQVQNKRGEGPSTLTATVEMCDYLSKSFISLVFDKRRILKITDCTLIATERSFHLCQGEGGRYFPLVAIFGGVVTFENYSKSYLTRRLPNLLLSEGRYFQDSR